MKPLRLEFQAFGSYPNREVVDFTVLAKRGLFVVTGPTGTGKSTIFDAMVYALYGDLPGSRSGKDIDCRSQHASLSNETYVQLDFEVDGVVYRVHRKPAQLRAAKRGGGTTTQTADASLGKMLPDGTTEPVASKVTPVTDHCKSLVGLDASQFQRVVLLPQGAFTAFLLAKEQEREDLLRPLFGGQVYRQATQLLKEEMLRLDKVVEKSDNAVGHHLSNAAKSLAIALLAWLAEDVSAEDLQATGEAAMQQRVDALQAVRTGRLAAVDQVQKAAQEAGEKAVQAESKADLFDRAAAAASHLKELEARKEQADRDRARWSDSYRARPAVKAGGVVDAAAAKVRAAQADLDALLAAVRDAFGALALPVPEPTAPAVSAAVTQAAQALRTDQQFIEAAGKAQTAVNDAEAAVAAAEQELAGARAAVVAAEGEVQARQAEAEALSPVAALVHERRVEAERAAKALADRQDLEAASGAAQAAAAAVVAAGEAVAQATAAVAEHQDRVAALSPIAAEVSARRGEAEAADTAVTQRQRLHQVQGELVTAQGAANTAAAAYVEVMTRFIATQAPRLAETLADGKPCPVCGSAEHPHPARVEGDDAVDHEAVDAARAVVAAADAEVVAASTEAAHLAESLGASAVLEVGAVIEARDAAKKALAEATTAARDLTAAQAALEEAGAAKERAREAEATCITDAAVADQKVRGLEAMLGAAAGVDVGVLRVSSDEAAGALRESEAASVRLATVQQAVQAATSVLGKAQVTANDCATAREVRVAAITDRKAALAAAQADAAHVNPKALVMRIAVVQGLEERMKGADAVFGGVTAAGSALHTATEALTDVLASSGFASVVAAAAVCLSDADEAALKASVEAWEQDVTKTQGTLVAYREQGVPDVRPNAVGLREEADIASQLAKDAAAEFTTASNALEAGGNSLAEARDVGAASAAERAQRDVARTVFQTCNGEAGFRVRLERWVLARELERVTLAANVHLGRMSNGRYLLKRNTTKGGLVLEVQDSHTGQSRATNSLSGGEQFQASLSLALGLADVVSHGGAASGKHFEALFVDEGFGSLDQEALTQAIDALEQIHAGGRMVGAITHVEEMKQRLHQGIEVTRLPNDSGSTLRVNP